MNIGKIILQLVCRRSIIFAAHLSESGKPGLDQPALGIPRNFAHHGLGQLRAFRSRADQTHRAIEDIDQLGNFINPGRSEKSPDTDHTVIIRSGQHRAEAIFGSLPHGSQLVNDELAATFPHPSLPEENRTG